MVASCNDDSKLSRCMIYMLGIAETLFLEFSPGHRKIMNRRVSCTYMIVFAMNKGSLLLSQHYPPNSKSAVNLYEFRYGCWDVAEKVGRKSGANTAKRKRECLESRRRVSKLGLVAVRLSSHECKIVQEPLWNGSSIMGKDVFFFVISFASNCVAEAAGVLIFL